jgi:hypothetical protein
MLLASKLMEPRFSGGAPKRQSALVPDRRVRYACVMVIFTTFLLLAATQAPAQASAHASAEPLPAESHNFGDWVVACDNGLRCKAVSLVPALSDEEAEKVPDPWERFGVMRLEREAGAATSLEITITDFEGVPARLLAGDQPLDVRFAPAEEGVWRVIPADLDGFISNMYSGTLVAQDAAGKALAEFALGGSHGAMLYMDERQGRLRTPTALVRKGSRPASLVPPPARLPVVTRAPVTTEKPLKLNAAQLRDARRRTGCVREEMGGEDSQSYHALGNGRTLVLLSCGSGAYNFNSLPMIARRERGAVRVEPAGVDERLEAFEDRPARFLVTNADYDPAERRLVSYAKGRGLGDCGIVSFYAWDGTRFRLVRQDEMSECRGTPDMLTTWQVEER